MANVTVGEWVSKTEARLTAVIQQSSQDVINQSQKLRSRGGNMPLDTGFLVNSGAAKIGGMPSGQSKEPDGYLRTGWDSSASVLVLNRLKPGDVLYFGWVANYARYMENRYGFVRLAAQNWQAIVRRNADKLRRMSGGN